MFKSTIFPEVDASGLQKMGIINILRTPTTIDKNPLPWKRIASVGVRAALHETSDKPFPLPLISVVVHFKKERDPRGTSFYTKQTDAGGYSVSTVSGVEAGMVNLSEEMTRTIGCLAMESMNREPEEVIRGS